LTLASVDAAGRRRLVILADWLPPDFGAVGQYMQLRAQTMADAGHEVTLIGLTSADGSVVRRANGRGQLTEIRLPARPVPRASLPARLAWTIGTNLRLLAAASRHLRRADDILFTGSPPFLVHVLAPLRPLWRGRLVYRITDFHPECLIAAQDRPSRLLMFLQRLTNFWRRRIDAFEVLGFDQWQRLRDLGIADNRISLVRDRSPVDFSGEQVAQPLPSALEGKCVLLYSGNFGVAHELETVAQGYQRHHQTGSGRVHLWLNATGIGATILTERLACAGVPFFCSAPVPLKGLAGLLLSADANLVTLKDAFVGFVMPSKIYACLDMHRPLLFVGSDASDVDLLARGKAGLPYWRIDCGDAAGFADALEKLADHLRPATR
jgi:hypothetical protein